MNAMTTVQAKLEREWLDSEWYEFYTLAPHIVIAPRVCGGRPTFKYTRLEVSVILALLASGKTIEEVVAEYAMSDITVEHVQEAIIVADQALSQSALSLLPLAA